ncbi:hypothetical protein [Salinicoccus sp. CNSTN-B1]
MKFSKYLFAVPIAVALLTGCQGKRRKQIRHQERPGRPRGNDRREAINGHHR